MNLFPHATPKNFTESYFYPTCSDPRKIKLDGLDNEVVRAINAHKSVSDTLKVTPKVLNSTHNWRSPITHVVRYPDNQLESMVKVANKMSGIGTSTPNPDIVSEEQLYNESVASCMIFRKYAGLSSSNQYQRRWQRLRSHNLLKEAYEALEIPSDWEEINNGSHSTQNPQSIKETYLEARKEGYSIPDDFIKADLTSYGEAEAYYAAMQMGRHKTTFTNHPSDGDWVRNKVLQVSSGFLVPNPNPKLAPYVVDQLWIVEGADHSVRFIAIEIDGEHHLSEDRVEKDKRRDVYLNSLGYEVYRLAGWWCRIDPWAVLAEFMETAFGLNHVVEEVSFVPPDISYYCCHHCNHPMVRWDTDSIHCLPLSHYDQERFDSSSEDRLVFLHRECREQLYC